MAKYEVRRGSVVRVLVVCFVRPKPAFRVQQIWLVPVISADESQAVRSVQGKAAPRCSGSLSLSAHSWDAHYPAGQPPLWTFPASAASRTFLWTTWMRPAETAVTQPTADFFPVFARVTKSQGCLRGVLLLVATLGNVESQPFPGTTNHMLFCPVNVHGYL